MQLDREQMQERLQDINEQVAEYCGREDEPLQVDILEEDIVQDAMVGDSNNALFSNWFMRHASDAAIAFMLGRTYSLRSPSRPGGLMRSPSSGRILALIFVLLPILLLMLRQNWIPMVTGTALVLYVTLANRIITRVKQVWIVVAVPLALIVLYAVADWEWLVTHAFFALLGLAIGASYSRRSEYWSDSYAARIIGDQEVAANALEEVFILSSEHSAGLRLSGADKFGFQVFYPGGEKRISAIRSLN